MKFLSEKKIQVFFVTAILAMTLILVLYYFNTQKVKSSANLVDHTQEVLHKSDNVLFDIMNIETGSRGFLLTGNEIFLKPFYNSMATLYKNLEELKQHTIDNPNQQERIDSLKKETINRLSLTSEIINEKKQNGLSETDVIVFIEKARINFEYLRRIIAGINSEEFRLLNQRKIESQKNSKNSELIYYLLLFFIFILIVLTIFGINNQRARLKLNKELKQSADLFSNLFNFNPASIAIYRHSDGKIINVNRSFLQLIGFKTKDEVIGKTFAELNVFVNPHYGEEIFRLLKEKRSVKDLETNIKTPEGEIKWTSASVLFLEVDNTTCLFYVSIDITTRKNAEEQLLTVNKEIEAFTLSQKLFSNYSLSLIEASLDPLVTISTEGKITGMNEALAHITGLNREKLNGSDFFDYFTDPQKARQVYQDVFANGSVTDYPLTLHHKNGKLTDVLFNGSVYKDDSNNVLGAVVVARDVTAQKQASQYARSLIEASLDPLFTISPAGKITDMNNASVNITEVSRENLIGTDFFEYFTEPDKAREIYKQVFAEGFVADFPLTIRDGKLTEVLFNGSVYKDQYEKVLGVVVVARDITDHKRFEKELIEAKVFAELATVLAEEATDVAKEAKNKAEGATQIAEDAVKSKQQFLSNMSHEIRTPMNAIIGFTKVILKTEITEKQKEYLTAIKMSGDALIVLINDILDLAKVDAGKMTFEHTPFRLNLSVSAMLHLFETKILEKNLKLVTKYDDKIPAVLVGDSVRLHQIILNLVSNAIKFTTKGSIMVTVSLLKEDAENAFVEFAVIDTGIGIGEDRMLHIFENFQQATSETSRLYGGTGLGLAIAKQLVESQGGSIRVKSRLNEGSTFSFILPFQKTSNETDLESENLELDVDVTNVNVLVVEDIPLNQLLMKTLLADFGFENDIAGNGKIAIEKLKNNSFDIILMDLQMPEMNGFEATEYIRNKMNSQIPIIALTADVTTADLKKCRAVGMNDYISKPVDERLLYRKIVELVKKPLLLQDKNEESEQVVISTVQIERPKCIDLTYLTKHSKGNPQLMMEMIRLYLEQTRPLIILMNQSLQDNDWDSLSAAVHKMIPSFSIMGIDKTFENMAKKTQEYAGSKQNLIEVKEMVLTLGNICTQACEELQVEFNLIKNRN